MLKRLNKYKTKESMKKVNDNLDKLKGEDPFKVPEGYMEGLTDLIMSQLPEKSAEDTPKVISFAERARPWLYLAAVFAGLGLFFKIVIGPDFQGSNNSSDSLLVKSQGSEQTISTLTSVDDIEYQEYIENRYANYVLEGELRYSE